LQLSPRDPFSAIYKGNAASAEFLRGNYREAMRLAREAIRQRTDLVVGYRVFTAAAAMAGEIELARASVEELRRVQPGISLAWMAEHVPLREDDHDSEAFRSKLELYLEALRRAGLE
jgi:hypothetical protein